MVLQYPLHYLTLVLEDVGLDVRVGLKLPKEVAEDGLGTELEAAKSGTLLEYDLDDLLDKGFTVFL